MTGLQIKHSHSWQVSEPLSPAFVADFMRYVDIDDLDDAEHWIWRGQVSPAPSLRINGKTISALRVAWAIKHPGQFIPFKLYRNRALCNVDYCVQPDHLYGKTDPPIAEGFSANDGKAPRVPIHRPLWEHPEHSPALPTAEYTPWSSADYIHQLSAEDFIKVLCVPGVSILNWPSGHVLVQGPRGKAEADDPTTAILMYLRLPKVRSL